MQKLYALFNRLKNNIESDVEDAVIETKDKIVEFVKDQTFKGEGPEGEKLGRYQNPKYAAKKYQINNLPGYGQKDYFLTGEYYKGFFAAVDYPFVRLGSTDLGPHLSANDISPFGLQKENQQAYLQKDLLPAIIKNVEKTIEK